MFYLIEVADSVRVVSNSNLRYKIVGEVVYSYYDSKPVGSLLSIHDTAKDALMAKRDLLVARSVQES